MAISWHNGADGAGTVTLPASILSGDIILLAAMRDGSNSAPSAPSGGGTWGNLQSVTGSSSGARLDYKIADGTESGASVTVTNSTCTVVGVWRGVDGGAPPSAAAGGTTHPINYPALTFSPVGSTSKVVLLGLHRSVNTALESAPAGYTQRVTRVDANTEGVIHESTSTVTSFAGISGIAPGGTASGWRTFSVQLEEYVAPAAPSAFPSAAMIGW